jgi:hypothetical protein
METAPRGADFAVIVRSKDFYNIIAGVTGPPGQFPINNIDSKLDSSRSNYKDLKDLTETHP